MASRITYLLACVFLVQCLSAETRAQTATSSVADALDGKTCIGTYDTKERRDGNRGAFGGAKFVFFKKGETLWVHTYTENGREAYANFATLPMTDRGESEIVVSGVAVRFSSSTGRRMQMSYDVQAQSLNGFNETVDFKTMCK